MWGPGFEPAGCNQESSEGYQTSDPPPLAASERHWLVEYGRRSRGWYLKLGDVGTRQYIDSNFSFVPVFVIILRDVFPDLSRCRADDRVGICVVIRLSAKNLNSERTFF